MDLIPSKEINFILLAKAAAANKIIEHIVPLDIRDPRDDDVRDGWKLRNR
jgi:hypothetical protein